MLSTQEMSDRLEIQDLLVAYCTAIDGKNWDALDEIFTADAFIDYTAAGGAKGNLTETKAFLDKAMAKGGPNAAFELLGGDLPKTLKLPKYKDWDGYEKHLPRHVWHMGMSIMHGG